MDAAAGHVDATHGLAGAAAEVRQAGDGAAAVPAAVRGAVGSGRRQGAVRRPRGGPPSRRGGVGAGADHRAQLGDPARRARPSGPAAPAAAGLPRRADAAAGRRDDGADRARGGGLAGGRAPGASPAAAAPDAGDHPAGGVRTGARTAAGRPARRADRGADLQREPAVGAAGDAARAALDAHHEALPSRDGQDRRADLHPDRGAAGAGRRRTARRRAGDAAERAPRGRLADVPPGAARRADDRAGRRPRDDRLAAGLGARAPGPRAGGARPPGRRAGPRRGRLSRRDGHRDPPAATGAAQRRAATGQAAGADRRLRLPAGGGPAGQRLSDPPRPGDLPGALRVPARAVPRRLAGPTPGSRSAAGAGAAWERASRCRR